MVKILWSVGYYDGPLSGMCVYEGERRWFDCHCDGGWILAETFDDDAVYLPRVYTVRKLDLSALAFEHLNHYIFMLLVGWKHWSGGLYWRLFDPKRTLPYRKSVAVGAFADHETIRSTD